MSRSAVANRNRAMRRERASGAKGSRFTFMGSSTRAPGPQPRTRQLVRSSPEPAALRCRRTHGRKRQLLALAGDEGGRHGGLEVRLHPQQVVVVVGRVEVEDGKRFGAGRPAELDALFPGRMSPTAAAGVF